MTLCDGYVYILTNRSMPGLVKIGRTTRSPEQRLTELWQTGVPTPFEVYHYVRTPSCVQLEAMCHQALADVRVDEAREFFAARPEVAKTRVNDLAQEVFEHWLDLYRPNHIAVEEPAYICCSIIDDVARGCGVDHAVARMAIQLVQPEDVQKHIGRAKRLCGGAE